MNEPEDWLRHWDEGTQVVDDFIFPQGPYEKNGMSDTIYHKGATAGDHQHRKATYGRGSTKKEILRLAGCHPADNRTQ